MSSKGNISTPRKRSTSSSSYGSSSPDLFQVDTVKLASSEDEQNDVSSDSSAKSEVDNTFPSPTSSFEVYSMTHNKMDMSPTQIPPIQVMDRSAGYDPYRIPSSVFSTNKSSSPMEWSITSNESLFSIHLGNNSFSMDGAFKFDEVGKSEESTKSGEFDVFSPPPIVMVEDADTSEESVETEDSKTSEVGEAFRGEEKAGEDHEEVKNSHDRRSSEQSFAFPVKKRERPLCYCSNCSWAFCYYNLSSCCLRWPRCYCPNCSWAFCYCWNCSDKGWSSPILTKSDGQNSVKTDVPWQPSEEKTSPITSSSTYNGWCGWFSWSCTSCCTCGKCCHCC